MRILALLIAAFIAVVHIAIMVLEMLFWDHPIGRQIFGTTPEVSASSATLAANQGLYNGFLAAGLIWGIVRNRFDVLTFFLGCVLAAGIFGGLTAKTSILFVQGLPALAGLIVLFFASRDNTRE